MILGWPEIILFDWLNILESIPEKVLLYITHSLTQQNFLISCLFFRFGIAVRALSVMGDIESLK